ncbi:hypothetical protein [Paeniglutamicibacter gangotriensis]|uniref:hypothetical protein n=1 Tax=Paeniglutamicibacter gangotriensis TaxID=254787 RepID=UPI0021D023EC|nr:hypothetical protein [Paeniglutamicibacter gangotriensis]
MTAITYRQALNDALRSELLRDENVILLGEEIGLFEGSYKITAGLLSEFAPLRVRDTPIAEEGFVGAAMLGMGPVVEIMTLNFSLIAIDQIVNHAAEIHGMFGGQGRAAACRHPLAEPGCLVRPHPRAQDRGSILTGGCQGTAGGGHP